MTYPEPMPPTYPSTIERNFEMHRISTNPDVEYLRHPSGPIVVLLSEQHEILQKTVERIEWNTSQKKGRGFDKSKQQVTGKGKKGGQQLWPDSRLCIVHCTDGSEHTIRAGIKATLVEVNERLFDDPNLIRTARNYHGYIAILLPPAGDSRSTRMPKEFRLDQTKKENDEVEVPKENDIKVETTVDA